MTPEEFCRWLQGYAELGGGPPTEAQWKLIKEHLQLIYTKVTSPYSHTEGTLADSILRGDLGVRIC